MIFLTSKAGFKTGGAYSWEVWKGSIFDCFQVQQKIQKSATYIKPYGHKLNATFCLFH